MSTASKNKNLIITLASIGHALELYDYLLYGVMIPFLAPVFFPAENSALSLILGYLSFAIAFVFAPIGSIFWGWFGDKFGRQKLLRFSIVFMALPALGIACLPTYASVGILAPILLILMRVLQGVSASGEVMGSKIFAMEHLGAKHYGLVSGVVSAAGGFGLLFAMLTGLVASKYTDYPDFWRVPFLIGFCIYFVGVLIRQYLSETMPFLHEKKKDNRSPFYIFNIIRDNFQTSLLVFSLGGMTGVMSYTLNTFINPYIIKQGIDKSIAYEISAIGIVATIIGALLAGHSADRSRSYWKMLLLSVALYAVLQPFLFSAIHNLDKEMISASIIAYGFLLGAFATLSSIAMYSAFPTHLRCRGVLFNYSFGVGVCGGFAPLVLQLIDAVHIHMPMLAIVCFSLLVLSICWRQPSLAAD